MMMPAGPGVSMDDALRDVQRALRRARDLKKKRANRRDAETGLSKECFDTALCIGLLADYDMRAGAAWLESSHRGSGWRPDGVDIDDMLQRLRNTFLESDIDALDALRDPEQTSLSKSAFACAARVAEEYKLGLWVREKNLVERPCARRASSPSSKGGWRPSHRQCSCEACLRQRTSRAATGPSAGDALKGESSGRSARRSPSPPPRSVRRIGGVLPRPCLAPVL